MLDRDLADRCGAIAAERGSTVQGVASLLLRAAFESATQDYLDSCIFPALRRRGPKPKPVEAKAPAVEPSPAPEAPAAELVQPQAG